MTLEELREVRELTLSNGSWFDSRDDHMRRLAVIDEHIAAREKQ